jgi:hypothetical protein
VRLTLLIVVVMLTRVQRDRDDIGTAIPVLIPTAKGEHRDGWISQEYVEFDDEGNGYRVRDRTVRMVPFSKMAALISNEIPKRGERWQLKKEERQELIVLATLVEGAARRDQAKLRSYIGMESAALLELADLNRWSPEDRRRIAISRAQNAFRVIGNELNSGLRGVRFVVWWVEGQRHLAPGQFCQDLRMAVMALLVSRITASQNFAVCALPSCRKQFVRVKKNNRYCSRKCGDTRRKQLSRARIRRQQRKGKGNGT